MCTAKDAVRQVETPMSETTNEGPLGIIEETYAILYGPGGRVEPSMPDRTPPTEATKKTGPSSGTCPRHTNDTGTGQRHGTNVHSEGCSARAERHSSTRERKNGQASGNTVTSMDETTDVTANANATEIASTPAPLSAPLEGVQGSWELTGHADEEVQTPGGIKAAYKDDATSCQAGTKLNEDDMAAAAQSQTLHTFKAMTCTERGGATPNNAD
ncbi:hypothetical protein BU15DRAFT_64004 [Melanogaster broomeanus]|nr:hypothetical protein BU15DRAFT_64004 [Melanogaster broomeanus]